MREWIFSFDELGDETGAGGVVEDVGGRRDGDGEIAEDDACDVQRTVSCALIIAVGVQVMEGRGSHIVFLSK